MTIDHLITLTKARKREQDAKFAAQQQPTPKSFWSYQAPTPPGPPAHMTVDQWESLSPGMRREIARQQPDLWGAK